MVSSFKRSGNFPPPRYRTPSPPRYAFEPLSPTPHSESNSEATPGRRLSTVHLHHVSAHPKELDSSKSDVQRMQIRAPSQDPMEAFASIALKSASESSPQIVGNVSMAPPSQDRILAQESIGRPSKRARSEKLHSPERIRAQVKASSRPTTSYERIVDCRRMDAELLLNFSQAARFSAPATKTPYQSHTFGTGYPSGTVNRQWHFSPKTSSQENMCDPDLNVTTGTASKANCPAYGSSAPSRGGRVPPTSSSATNIKRAQVPETPMHSFRYQLVEASKTLQHQVDPVEAAESLILGAASHQVQGSPRHPRLMTEDEYLYSDRPYKDREAAETGAAHTQEEIIGSPQSGDAFGANEDLQARTQPLVTHQQHLNSTDGYWPSMLATTVEQSASAWKHRLSQALAELGSNRRQAKSGTGEKVLLHSSAKVTHPLEPATCAACKFTRNSMSVDTDCESSSWISCDGCKSWFHFACAGFKNEREVRAVDKYRCRNCKAVYGPTTYVRKSTRAHTAIDYAGLNQGVVKTSDERPEHHYIKPIKDGTINFQAENFARMRPELITAEYFEKGNGMKEPIVVPAEFNPRPKPVGSLEPFSDTAADTIYRKESDMTSPEDWFAEDPECQNVPDHGQDALDMVMPPNLTVRKVAELYGPEEKVEVIDVKSQNGAGKRWNMKRWADYYENTSNKVVRNVISLEVSQSTLGRLIRRPQIVRDLDLQDSVWPADLQARGEFPRVQFYCLMSVADCFTDFHIDFGGSSVFYHILKGKKTFFFIPPKEKHLKRYEEWCMSPAQNWTFLADQTKECYRVDLSEGDTMLIPAGWIHAVWTPEDSLVIGGNFLTRLSYSMQLRIAQIEKATGVARKFRYPHFQKIQWYTAIRYLETDPVPSDVRGNLQAGGVFYRPYPAFHDFDLWGENSRSGPENYHARYYSQSELEGLPDLVRYLLRTALIDSGEITDGVTVEARNAVKKSIPRGFGEPLEIVKNFALWSAWKRGNESIPHWAHPDAIPEVCTTDPAANAGNTALKKGNRENSLQAPRRHSSRNRIQRPTITPKGAEVSPDIHERNKYGLLLDNLGLPSEPNPQHPINTLSPFFKETQLNDETQQLLKTSSSTSTTRRKRVASSSRKTACESCRKRRRGCKHKMDKPPEGSVASEAIPNDSGSHQRSAATSGDAEQAPLAINMDQTIDHEVTQDQAINRPSSDQHIFTDLGAHRSPTQMLPSTEILANGSSPDVALHEAHSHLIDAVSPKEVGYQRATPLCEENTWQKSVSPSQIRGKSKACSDCRKSKRRCRHDENGKEDPLDVQEAASPKLAGALKRRKLRHDAQSIVLPLQPRSINPPKRSPGFSGATETNVFCGQQESPGHTTPPTVVLADSLPADGPMSDQPLKPNNVEEVQLPELNPNFRVSRPTSMPINDTRVDAEAVLSLSSTGEEMGAAQIPIQGLGENFSLEKLRFEQPAASSLVSPPASSHDGYEQPTPTVDPRATCSGSSSRHSSRHPMQTQRFTPESGPARRNSSSSIIVDTRVFEVKSPSISPLSINSAQRLSSDTVADEESLRLIRALQAEDYGLRRRSDRVL
ncbi:MAG: hypothetical protein Q9219_006204 [cf. Caloplaca sp. 3 TL-2023]